MQPAAGSIARLVRHFSFNFTACHRGRSAANSDFTSKYSFESHFFNHGC